MITRREALKSVAVAAASLAVPCVLAKSNFSIPRRRMTLHLANDGKYIFCNQYDCYTKWEDEKLIVNTDLRPRIPAQIMKFAYRDGRLYDLDDRIGDIPSFDDLWIHRRHKDYNVVHLLSEGNIKPSPFSENQVLLRAQVATKEKMLELVPGLKYR